MKKIHIIGGGTFSHVRNHLALCAPAFGSTAKFLSHAFRSKLDENLGITTAYFRDTEWDVELHLTKMAEPTSKLETNQDVADLVDRLVADPETRIIVMSAALCDFKGEINGVPSSKYADRLHTRKGMQEMDLFPAEKILGRIRQTRKDIFLVAFKTTTDATPQEQYVAALDLLKGSSANLVLANDTVTRNNLIVVPEEASYGNTTDRRAILRDLVDMAVLRANLHFTRSTVVEGPLVPWTDERVPENLRTVVNHCIKRGAYKPFRGSTAGHFAVKLGDGKFLTSPRKHDFNLMPKTSSFHKIGMVLVETDGPDSVIAHGARPSVGGQSQRIVFADHPETDCIVHFHCPMKPDAEINVRSQREFECGSHECGQNTSRGLVEHCLPGGHVKAVMLDNHGPNIVFSRDTPAEDVINFIERNFDLTEKTGGPVDLQES